MDAVTAAAPVLIVLVPVEHWPEARKAVWLPFAGRVQLLPLA